jgi:uncharacterized protein YjbJ (UPF0337 family)
LDKDRVTGKIDQAVGKAKQKIGDAVGNDRLANQGVADQVKGSAKETVGNVTDAAHETAAADRETASEHITDAKNKINSKIENFKDRERAKDRHTA